MASTVNEERSLNGQPVTKMVSAPLQPMSPPLHASAVFVAVRQVVHVAAAGAYTSYTLHTVGTQVEATCRFNQKEKRNQELRSSTCGEYGGIDTDI